MEGTNSLVEPNEILGTTPITQIKGPFRQISTLYENRLNDENYYENPYKGASYTISKYPGKIEPSEIYMSEKDMLSHNIKLKLELKLKLKQKNQAKYQNLEQIQHQDQQLGRLYHDRKRNKEITFFKIGSAGNHNRRLDEATSGKNVIFQRNHINGKSTDDRSLLPTPVLIPIKPTMKHGTRSDDVQFSCLFLFIDACSYSVISTSMRFYPITYRTLPYLTLSYPTISHPTLLYPILSYPPILYRTLPYPTLPYPTTPYPILPHFPTLSYHAASYPTPPYSTVP